LYLRNAQVIEEIASATDIVFDKTGTLTSTEYHVSYHGLKLSPQQRKAMASVAAQSTHPLSMALSRFLSDDGPLDVQHFTEVPGKGIKGRVCQQLITLGSKNFVTGKQSADTKATRVYANIDNGPLCYFEFGNQYRDNVMPSMAKLLRCYDIAVISGDSSADKQYLQKYFGAKSTLLFEQQPADKLDFIERLQSKGRKVIMVGDGLNDAGALRQSDAGIAITDDTNNFTPSSDAILAAAELPRLAQFIRLCKANKQIVVASFILSILYNAVGLFFAVQGTLSPLIAAILMPSSSLSILVITFGSSNLMAKQLNLKNH
jgi:Cu+-exporting ATPase